MSGTIEDFRPSTANELQNYGTLICCLDEPDHISSFDVNHNQKTILPVLTPKGRVNKILHVLLRSNSHPLLQRQYIPTREGHFAKELRVWVGMDLDYHGPTADAQKFLQLLEVATVADKLHIQIDAEQPRTEGNTQRVFWMEFIMCFDHHLPRHIISPTERAMIPAAARRHFRLLKDLHGRGQVDFMAEEFARSI